MSVVAGADGCPGGWICIRLDTQTGEISSEMYRTAASLIEQAPEPVVLISTSPLDFRMPVVERATYGQEVSIVARRSSVFPSPIRRAIACESQRKRA